MAYLEAEPRLPFSGRAPMARQCSRDGAVLAQPRAGSQADRLLALYREQGPQTDHEAAKALELPLATICARRNELVARGLVEAQGSQLGPFGTRNTRWGMK